MSAGDALKQGFNFTMWKEQYDRMFRSFEKAKRSQIIVPHYAVGHSCPGPDQIDEVYACAQNIYHLKDWVISTGVISKEDIYKFIDETESFKICEKICIGTKHLTTEFREGDISINIHLQDAPYTQKGSWNKEFLYVVEYEGKKYRILELFEELMLKWQMFLKEKSVL